MKYNIEYLKNNKVAVHCQTKEEEFNFIKSLNSAGVVWASGDKLLPLLYGELEYGDKQGYCLYSGNGKLGGTSINWYKKNGFTIITGSDFFAEPSITPSSYTLEEVTEIARKAFAAANEEGDTIFEEYRYKTFEDYLKSNPIKK